MILANTSLKTHKSRIPENTIEEIRSRADILEVVSEFVPLKKAGKNYKGLCPFHSEKTPSFNVSQEKQFFHCFGCGKGGSVFNFLMEIEDIPFVDAVRKLGYRYHVPIPEKSLTPFEEKRRSERETLIELNELASNYFSGLLQDEKAGAKAREYIEARGFDPKTVMDYQLGWSPPGWRGLLDHLAGKNKYSPKLMEKAGLISIKPASGGKQESRYDRFRGRIIFPFKDVYGNIIGFGGRVISDEEPKYLNSPETPLYIKGNHLFGLHKSREAIRREDRALIVEGYFDQIGLHQHGIENTVALCGTALTLNQISLLRKYTAHVTLVFDSDSAGQAAAQRGFELLLDEGMSVSVVTLPQGYDPDSFIGEKGQESFLNLVQEAQPFILNLIDKTAAVKAENDPASKFAAINKILALLTRVKSSVERSEYVRRLAEKTGIDQKALLEDLTKQISGHKPKVEENFSKIRIEANLEHYLIHLILADESAAREIRDQVTLEAFEDPLYKEIAELFYSIIDVNQPVLLDRVMDQEVRPEIKSLLTNIGMSPINFEPISQAVTDCIVKIKKRSNKQKIIELKKLRDEAHVAGEIGRSRELHNLMKDLQP